MAHSRTYHTTSTSTRSQQQQRPRSSGSNSGTASSGAAGRGRSQQQQQQQWGGNTLTQPQPEEPSLYEVLAITPKQLDSQSSPAAQTKTVKQAYRRALLRYHPDKQQAQKKRSQGQGSSSSSSSSASSSPSTSPSRGGAAASSTSKSKSTATTSTSVASKSASLASTPTYTVDQIQEAYSVLSDSRQRSNYDRQQQLKAQQAQYQHQNGIPIRGGFPAFTASFSASTGNRNSTSGKTSGGDFATGVETVDLDDLEFDPRRGGVYHRGCRCGNARGYVFTDDDLERFEDQGILMVECRDCSLWLRVLFAPAGEEDDAEDQVGEKDRGELSTAKSSGAVSEKQGTGNLQQKGGAHDAAEMPGASENKGWTFNWSFNVGISVSGSSSAGKSNNADGDSSKRDLEKRR